MAAWKFNNSDYSSLHPIGNFEISDAFSIAYSYITTF